MLTSIAALLLAPTAADLVCITDKVPVNERRAAFEEALTGKGGAMREKIAGLAAGCGKDGGWSAPQVRERELAALLEIVFPPALDRLEQGRIPQAALRKWFEAQKAEVRADPGNHVEALPSLYKALTAAGATTADIDASAEPIGIVIALLSSAEKMGYVLRR